jgi:hypothetical protein
VDGMFSAASALTGITFTYDGNNQGFGEDVTLTYDPDIVAARAAQEPVSSDPSSQAPPPAGGGAFLAALQRRGRASAEQEVHNSPNDPPVIAPYVAVPRAGAASLPVHRNALHSQQPPPEARSMPAPRYVGAVSGYSQVSDYGHGHASAPINQHPHGLTRFGGHHQGSQHAAAYGGSFQVSMPQAAPWQSSQYGSVPHHGASSLLRAVGQGGQRGTPAAIAAVLAQSTPGQGGCFSPGGTPVMQLSGHSLLSQLRMAQ